MSRRFKFLFLIFFLIFIQTGCKDLKEVDRITFPVVLGIDWDETSSNIKIYAQVSTMSSQPGGQNQSTAVYSVLNGEGKTLIEAMDIIIDHAQQYISWKQIIAVVITDKMAKHGISKELDVLIRNEQIHLNSYLIITTENLRELLGTAPIIDTGLPTSIVGVGLVSEQGTHSKAVTIKDFIMATLTKEIEPVLPLLVINRKDEKQKEKTIELDYKGLGVFKDEKLIGWLDENETSAMLFVSGIKGQGYLNISRPQNEEEIIVSELTTNTKFIPYMQNNKPGTILKISVEYDIYSYVSDQKLDLKEVQRINSLVRDHIKSQVEAVIKKAQQDLNADVFGLGGKIYRKYPEYWIENMNDWSEIFSSMDVKVEVEAKIRDTGELSGSLK